MPCNGCTTQRGCNNTTTNPSAQHSCGNCSSGSCNKLHVFNWLANISEILPEGKFPIVEVRFKNSRKDYFINNNNILLTIGDLVVTEADTGYDVGTISATGEVVRLQLRKKDIKPQDINKKILRKAKQADIDKWQQAIQSEKNALLKSRELAQSLNLEMKLIDVEYQGDKTKGTFYYTADGRVDFRELIKKLAAELKIKIEMRQIGARQESARLGGIGVCGRELCCSTWLNDFRTVNTNAVRYQQLSFNPSKLAGQCGKLKCCLNYELDAYIDALKEFPEVQDKVLITQKGKAKFIKMDIFKRTIYWAYETDPGTFIPLSIEQTNEMIKLNEKNIFPEDLLSTETNKNNPFTSKEKNLIQEPSSQTDDNINRFDNQFKKRHSHKNKRKN